MFDPTAQEDDDEIRSHERSEIVLPRLGETHVP